MPEDIAAGGCSTGPQTRSAGQVDPDTFRILETIKHRGAFIEALDELSAFAAIERKMIRTRCEEGSEGRWRTLLGSGQSLSSTLTRGNRLGGCCRMGNRSERWHDCLAWITSRILGAPRKLGALSFCSEILNVSTPSTTPKPGANGRVGP